MVSEKPSTIQEPSDSGAPTHDQPAVALHVPQLLLQPRVLLLFLQQPPLHSAQLLLGLTLDVIGHHHRRLQVRLEAPPLLGFLLKMPDPPHTHQMPTRAGTLSGAGSPVPNTEKDQLGSLSEALAFHCREKAQGESGLRDIRILHPKTEQSL